MHDDLTPHRDNHEAAMARADLYKLANYSMKLFKMIQEGQELEGWVQAKVTKAADYIASVYHFMEYEMKTSEYGENLNNSDVYSESVRRVFQQKLTEAKAKAQAIKKKAMKDEKVEEGFPTVADAKERHEKEKGTGKFDKKKISTGTVYTRKADKDIESDDDEDTPKKSKKVKEGGEQLPSPPDEVHLPKKGSKHGPVDVYRKKEDKLKEGAKPDFLDMDKDGNKKEPMKKAVKDAKVKEVAMSPAPAQKKSGIPSTATTTVPGMKATPADLKKANSSAALGEGKCNHTAKGKKCPVHGLKECGSMYETKNKIK